MKLEQTQDELLGELWANHRDLGDILTLLSTLLNCDVISGSEESGRRCFALLRDRVSQYTTEIQHISDVLVRKAV